MSDLLGAIGKGLWGATGLSNDTSDSWNNLQNTQSTDVTGANGLGKSDFAQTGGSSFGGNFNTGAPSLMPEFNAGDTALGGWKQTENWKEIEGGNAWYKDPKAWGEMFSDIGATLASLEGKGEKVQHQRFNPKAPQAQLSTTGAVAEKMVQQSIASGVQDDYQIDAKVSGGLSKGSLKDLLSSL